MQATLHLRLRPRRSPCARLRSSAGIDSTIVSSFRDFARQEAIWNAKYRGERPLLDRAECAIDPASWMSGARVDAILLWSALPGASRHHWGTDIDVVDRAAVVAGLPAAASSRQGVRARRPVQRARTSGWARTCSASVFRPYTEDRGGVQPEPWHLSYAPVAVPALEALTPEVLMEAIAASSMHGREHVLARLPELHARFVATVSLPSTRLS